MYDSEYAMNETYMEHDEAFTVCFKHVYDDRFQKRDLFFCNMSDGSVLDPEQTQELID